LLVRRRGCLAKPNWMKAVPRAACVRARQARKAGLSAPREP
jgi:hypothetical protein